MKNITICIMNLIISIITLACVLVLFVLNYTGVEKENVAKIPVNSSASLQNSSNSEEKEEKIKDEKLISLTPPDMAHTSLLRTDKEGLTYLSNHGFYEGQQAAKSYIYENNQDLERKKDGTADGVYYYIWVNSSFVYELENTELFKKML